MLYSIASGIAASRRALLVDPSTLLGVGLLVALVERPARPPARPAVHDGGMDNGRLGPAVVDIGTPLLFDVGVFLAVIGVVLTIVFTLADVESERGLTWSCCWRSLPACSTQPACT